MSPEARKFAQALLDHRKQVCRLRTEASAGVDSCLITYGDLCKQAGLSHLKPNVGKFLREVAQWCHDKNWPPLNSLAVNHETRRPGNGYGSAPGCSQERWLDEVAACINFAGYPDAIS
ncbi:MAG TPA: hypothetical protein VLD83_07030 [Candidatus Binatia bacterium]|nr:hypothetical protein [Candidatus Binatia bacterium]